MASLVGKAQEDDESFWSHSIWSEAGGGFADKASRKRRRDEEGESSSGSEDGGSGDEESDGEGSFRMSDEDPDAAVDKFDSDFDESESEDEAGDGDGEEEEELRAEERRTAASKRKKNQRLGVPLKASAGRELMKKKSGKTTKRGPLGEGWNEGLVLNWPPPSGGATSAVAKSGGAAPLRGHLVDSRTKTISNAQGSASTPVASKSKPQHIMFKPAINLVQTSKLRFPPPSSPSRHLRAAAASTSAPPAKPASKRHTAAALAERKKISKKRQFTQEELILESIKSTEPENAKWLSSRKRGKDEAAQLEKATAAGNSKKSSLQHKVLRFHSRRGCSNTLTFMDMDRLPEILTRRHAPSSTPNHSRSGFIRRKSDSTRPDTCASVQEATDDNRTKCAITGKIAKYRDPKTMLGYHDLDAYKEIRRRLEAGELIISQPLWNNDEMRIPSGPNDRVSTKRGLPNNTTKTRGGSKTYPPFGADQPIMIAETKSNEFNLKVIVTQGGVPVSPPSSKIPLNYFSVEGFEYGNRKEPHHLPPLVAAKNNDHLKAAIRNHHTNANYDAPEQIISNPPHPMVELQSRHYQSEQTIEQAQINSEATVNNRNDDGIQPHVARSSATSKVKVEIANGASHERAKSPPVNDVSTNSTTNGGKDDIVPERTTSNGKRATIEAN